MGYKSPNSTKVTRSISFDDDVFALMEERRAELRMDRSEFLMSLLEDNFDVLKHPEIRDPKHKVNEAILEKARAKRGGGAKK